MNPYLQQLIERERSRIADLRKRVEHYERRLNMLLELSQDDEEDPLLVPVTQADQCNAETVVPDMNDSSDKIADVGTPETEGYALPKKISANSLKLLWYFGQGQKTLDEATNFSNAEGLGMDRRNISSFANIYRNKFGLIESPAVGLYRLTSRGHEFVQSRYVPSEASAVDPADGL